MNASSKIRWIIPLVCGICCVFSLIQTAFATPGPFLDLSRSNWSEGAKPLEGPWEFYWDRLLQPGEQAGPADHIFQKPQGWAKLNLADGRTLPAFGKATYRLRVRGLAPDSLGYQVGLYAADSAFAITVYSEGLESQAVRVASGKPGDQAEEIASRRASFRSLFPLENRDTIILLHISNHQQASAGLWQAPLIGQHEAARKQFDHDGLMNILGLGIVIAIGIYSLMMFVRRREDLPALFLSLTALASFLRIISTNAFLSSLLPDQAFAILKKFEFMTMPMGTGAYLAFLQTAFFPQQYRKLVVPIWSLQVFLILLAFVIPVSLMTNLLIAYQLCILISASAMIVLITRATIQKQSGAWLVLFGCLLIISGSIFDIVITTEMNISNLLITPLCAAVFLILQSQVVAQRAAEAYLRAELYALELVEKEKARTLFFHNTSHELRTPLNGIIGFLQLVVKGRYGSIPEAASIQIAKSLKLADALKNQVNAILDIAKSRRGDLQKTNQLISLNEIKEQADNLADGLRLKSDQLTYISQLHITDTSSSFISDQEKVLTIIRNLLGNAFKFSAPDRPNHVAFELSYRASTLQILVKDTGIGIAPAYHQKIFEEFIQVQGDARRAYEGTGLGLTMVRDLVRLLGGTIKVESEPGQGSTFIVSLPSQSSVDSRQPTPEVQHSSEDLQNLRLLHQKERAIAASQSSPIATRPTQKTRDWHILIIDDTETNCEVISEILKEDGYQSSYQLSGRAGLLAMKKQKPDLLLLDMMMPEMSGEDVIKAMKADVNFYDIPIVLITARASEEDRLVGLKLGIDDYLAKPIVTEELLLRVNNLLERHQLLREVERHQTMDKMVQMGTLFADLSHEIKNILNGASTVPKLQKPQIHIALSPIDLQEQYTQALIQSISSGTKNSEILKRMSAIPPVESDEYQTIRQSLKGLLAESSLPYNMMLNLWNETQALPVDELVFLENQVRILSGYQTLAHITERTRSLSLSVLNYTRQPEERGTCQLEKVWPDALQLAYSRTRKLAIHWQVDLEDARIAVSQGALTQILLNLCLNAVDAIAELPSGDRWIKVSMSRREGSICLVVANGGPAVSDLVRSKLFTRGFTTKGEKGTGIGLYVSQRLAHQAQGELSYLQEASSPTFELVLPCAEEPALVKSA